MLVNRVKSKEKRLIIKTLLSDSQKKRKNLRPKFAVKKHLKISLALRARTILLAFVNFTRAYLFQIAMKMAGM